MYVIFINKDKELRYAINMDSVKSFRINQFDHKALRFYYTHDDDYTDVIFDTKKCLELGIKSLYEWMKAGKKVVYICLNDPSTCEPIKNVILSNTNND